MDERGGKSRGLPGENLWEKEETRGGDCKGFVCVCITGWEIMYGGKLFTQQHINMYYINTYLHTHPPPSPSFAVCINVVGQFMPSADKIRVAQH